MNAHRPRLADESVCFGSGPAHLRHIKIAASRWSYRRRRIYLPLDIAMSSLNVGNLDRHRTDLMSLRSLLVVLGDDGRCDARVQLAARFAAVHGSHLVGLAPTGLVELSSSLGAASRFMDEAANAKADAIQRAIAWTEGFEKTCRAMGVTSMETRACEGDVLATVLHHAHCVDAVVIGQADSMARSHRDAQRFVEEILLHNARPTLVVPCRGHFNTLGENVLIAWDDSPGSARATADALPVLRQAGRVHLRSWLRAGDDGERAVRERLDAVSRWLARLGVACEAQVDMTTEAIGNAIPDGAATLGADLIVMGTYGHARWTERLLGGATRSALAYSSVPLLMSH